jgi:hypothetical protein
MHDDTCDQLVAMGARRPKKKLGSLDEVSEVVGMILLRD